MLSRADFRRSLRGASIITGNDLTEPYVALRGAETAPASVSSRPMPAPCRSTNNIFDRAFSMLVLQFVPDTARDVAETQRVATPGGTVTAAV